MLDEGFKKIPDALRLRYPTEMSRVGNVPTERLAVGSFGKSVMAGALFGQVGETMNDIKAMQRIKQSEAAIARCIQTVKEQQQLMAVVQARIDQDIQNAQRNEGAKANATAIATPAAPPAARAPLPPAISSATMLELTSPHIVDEFNPAMQQHQIISVPLGAVVKLVKGTLAGGLGAPYNDYIEVEYNGRVGKISRLIVRPASSVVPAAYGSAPPPAYGVPQAAGNPF
jgi:hypothetical protein